MNITIRGLEPGDWPGVTAIFNHFARESFAVYSEQPVPEHFFRGRFSSHADYPFLIAQAGDQLIGFAYLAPLHPAQTMKRSATLTYFITPQYTGQGIGKRFLDLLLQAGAQMGITNYLANISSKNPGSLRFHLRNGFCECGRFREAGCKHGQLFDMVWVQKQIP